MKKRCVWLMLGIIGLAGLIAASEGIASKSEAQALVEKAAAFMKSNGKEPAMKEFSKPNNPFDKGELYVFAYDLKATVVAHPKNAKLIGKNLLEVPDTDGKLFRKEIVELAKAKGSGWVDYKYMNPDKKKVEQKTTYLLKVDDVILCCGTYR